MKWFDILKVLGTKSGFSQLDFDNIVIEDEDDCKKQWQEMCNRVEKAIKGIDLSSLLDDDVDYEFAENEGMVHGRLVSKLMRSYAKYARGGGSIDSEEFKEGYRAVINCSWGYNPKIPEEVYCVALDMLNKIIRGEDKKNIRIGDYNVSSKEYKKTWILGTDAQKYITVTIFDYVKYEYDIGIEILVRTGDKTDATDKIFDAVVGKLK